MAEYLASIYGTEKDNRKHVKPTFSQTILCSNIYQNPAHDTNCNMSEEQIQAHFDDFYEDFFTELCKYGEVEEMHVCDNVGDHLIGNVYARFRYEEDAQKAVDNLNQRFYAGRPIYAELSPVTDFREACCRQNENAECTRGGFCNFMHLKEVSRYLKKELFAAQRNYLREQRRVKRDKSEESRHSESGSSPPREISSDRVDRDDRSREKDRKSSRRNRREDRRDSYAEDLRYEY
ncbi:3073_t:CDS:2 [Funneliformis mosseae]|uniref:3073_t:CDS:1 n=2 Tax=Funneliformis TaxID=1117308 RepID=A0A9N9GWI3_FUNMO|nr:3073_t:CDS:2 [Funneliformis mosseae]